MVANTAVQVHVHAIDRADQLASDVRRGLGRIPKSLPPKWFYDERGSELFDEITTLPEYYLTERERAILEAAAPAIARRSEADTLVELGSGSADKTTTLLAAMRATGRLRRYVPFDVSAAPLRRSAGAMAQRFGIEVTGVVGDFEAHLDRIPSGGRRMVAFLGSTIGNLDAGQRRRFLATLAANLVRGESLLLGVDLVKDAGRLLAAYDDSAGVTAAFNRNVLAVMNRELGARFELERFAHDARWDRRLERMEMHLVSLARQDVFVEVLGERYAFAEGESILTEISCKFRRMNIERELRAAGFRLGGWWSDPAGDFAATLAFRA